MNLKEFRKLHNLSQERTALILNISRPTLIKIEKGKRGISPEEIHALKTFVNEPKPSVKIDDSIYSFLTNYNDISISRLGDLLETFGDLDLLNIKGKQFNHTFWETFIKTKRL